jgi:hypothetical protein
MFSFEADDFIARKAFGAAAFREANENQKTHIRAKTLFRKTFRIGEVSIERLT